MTTRTLQFPTDFSLFTDLLPATFQNPENEAWNVQPHLIEAALAEGLEKRWEFRRVSGFSEAKIVSKPG